MLETILIIASILGGIAALIAIWEFFLKKKKPEEEPPSDTVVEPPTLSLPPYFAHSKPLEEYWVGRKSELDQLDEWYGDKETKIIGVVALGGMGKSALARKWLEGIKADGIFWWCFYREDSLDAFLERALNYFSDGQFKPDEVKSVYARVRNLLDYINKGHFILVLDGLEDMQKADEKSEHFGEMKTGEFADLLRLWAEREHNSLALITTRYPLKDLQCYAGGGYHNIELKSMSPPDAIEFMKKRGVKGEDKDLDKLAKSYKYHALCLKLIAGYLVDFYGGNIADAGKIPFSEVEADKKVSNILEAYAGELDEAERVFMNIFSVFRYQVEPGAFAPVFGKQTDDLEFKKMLGHLVNLGLISEETHVERSFGLSQARSFGLSQAESQKGNRSPSLVSASGEAETSKTGEAETSKDGHKQQVSYSTHPLIRKYYYGHLDDKTRIQIHHWVAQYYEDKAHAAPKTLDDLTNAIEAFHHTIKTKDYEQAYRIYRQKINILDAAGNYLVPHNLGAFELDLSLISQLFPSGDTSREPLVDSARERTWLINEIGLCLTNLGRLAKAVPFFQRGIQMDLANKDWGNASAGSQNLCHIQLNLGNLIEGEATARQALDWARKAKHKAFELTSLPYVAYAAFLQGKNEKAEELFEQANELERKIDPTSKWIYSLPGIRYAEFLARSRKNKLAEEVTQENLIICQRNHWPDDIARCYRLLAVLALERKDYTLAEDHLNSGLQIARNIGLQEEIAPLYLGFARLHLAQNDLPVANTALSETLSICTRCGYMLIEIDARNILAQIHHAANKPDLARTQANTALTLSKSCGYHWGQVDAKETLKKV